MEVASPWSVKDVALAPLRATLPVRWRNPAGGVPEVTEGCSTSEWLTVPAEKWPEFALNATVNAAVADYVAAGRGSPYDVLVVPGYATSDQQVALHDNTQERLRRAAQDLRDGLANFVMVSGGDVHPDGTPYFAGRVGGARSRKPRRLG